MASQSISGLMSADDKKKIDNLATVATSCSYKYLIDFSELKRLEVKT